jgi:PTS system mannitol-specific IIC component
LLAFGKSKKVISVPGPPRSSPGSIFAWLAVTPPGNHIGVLLGIVLSATVSFLVGWVLLKTGRQDDYADLAGATAASKKMKKG